MSKDEILRSGIAALKSGNVSQATELFTQVVKLDPASEQGWLGLGYCMPTPERREYCFRRVLAINPDNRIAREQLARLSKPEPVAPPFQVKQSPFTAPIDDPAPAGYVSSSPAPVSIFKDEVSTVTPKLQASHPVQTASRAPRPNKKKKSKNSQLIPIIMVVFVFILIMSTMGIVYGVFFLGTDAGIPANKPAANQSNPQVRATPLATSSPTPDVPTPIPSPVPTVVYTPVYENVPCSFDTPNASASCGQLIVP